MEAVKKLIPTKVPLTDETITKCRCGYCPVQGNSRCVQEQESRLPQNRKKDPIPGDEIPGVYCSHGKATCPDLSFMNPCICGTCEIFNDDYRLADNHPAGYFCKGGKAI